MRKITLGIFALLHIGFGTLNLNSAQRENYTEKLTTLKGKIEENYYTFDSNKLESILKEVDELTSKYNDSWIPYYYSGLLQIQIGKIYYNPDPDLAYEYFDESVKDLLKALEIRESAGLYALLSCAYGKKSSLSTFAAFYYGLKARDYIYEARDLDAKNPKVYLIAATHLMHAPESFGGDKDWAERLLKKALEINDKQRSPRLIKWAADSEIYAYLAQLEILRANKASAEKYMEKALSLQPDYGFVKYDLKEQLRKIK